MRGPDTTLASARPFAPCRGTSSSQTRTLEPLAETLHHRSWNCARGLDSTDGRLFFFNDSASDRLRSSCRRQDDPREGVEYTALPSSPIKGFHERSDDGSP